MNEEIAFVEDETKNEFEQSKDDTQNSYQTEINGTHYIVSVASSEDATKTYEDLIKGHILNEIKDLPPSA